jgi:hypothetical protein
MLRVIRHRIVKKLALFVIFSLCIFSIPASYAEGNSIKNYLVDFVNINTPIGNSPFNESIARALIQNADISYSQISNNRIRFTFGNFYDQIKSETALSSCFDIKNLLADKFRSEADGYSAVITVGGMRENPSLGFAGRACGSYESSGKKVLITRSTLLNGYYSFNLTTTTTLLHELGHNLDLSHSMTITCAKNGQKVNCDSSEYGDHSDVMGSFGAVINGLITPIMRTSASNLDKLGLLSDKQIISVDNSAEIQLAPVYPVDSPGIKIAYLPVYDKNSYALEYRTATGPDSGLALSKIDILNGEGWFTPNKPSYGLQIRALNAAANESQNLLPFVIKSGSINGLFTLPGVDRQGFDPGAKFTLPDGSIVEFISADANGAKVKVTRPVDDQPPTVAISRVVFDYYDLKQDKEVTYKVTKDPSDIPELSYFFEELTDNRKIAEVAIVLDGVSYPISNYAQKEASMKVSTIGEHVSSVIVKDTAGNIFKSDETTFKILSYIYPPAIKDIEVQSGANPQVTVSISFYRDEEVDFDYQILDLPVGAKVKSTRSEEGLKFEITKLSRGAKINAILKRTDPLGNLVADTPIKVQIPGPKCTQSLCYVGMVWNAGDYYWKVPAPKLELQQKINGKWVTVASGFSTLKPGVVKGNNYYYPLNYTFPKAGTFTYRLYHPAHTYKGQKYLAYVGNPYTQKIIP